MEPIHDREDFGTDAAIRSGNFLDVQRTTGLHLDPLLPISRLPATFSF